MNRINVASEAVKITVNDAGDTIILNVQDQRFMHTVTALVSEFTENAQAYKAKCEKIAAMPHDTNEEKFAQLTAVAAVSNEICSMLKENRTAGYEVRAVEYMHWWTFLSLYQEMSSECTFAQILHIRDKLAHGKKLEKEEREWYNRNRSMIDLRSKYTAQDEALLEAWGVK